MQPALLFSHAVVASFKLLFREGAVLDLVQNLLVLGVYGNLLQALDRLFHLKVQFLD